MESSLDIEHPMKGPTLLASWKMDRNPQIKLSHPLVLSHPTTPDGEEEGGSEGPNSKDGDAHALSVQASL